MISLFLFSRKSARSKERSGCVYRQMKRPVWTTDTCTGVKQKRPLPPTWFSLQANAKEMEEIEQVLPCSLRGLQTSLGSGWRGKQVLRRGTLDTAVGRWGPIWDVCTEIIQLALTVRKAVSDSASQALICTNHIVGWGGSGFRRSRMAEDSAFPTSS